MDSCFAACGISLSQGPNPCPLHWQADSYPVHHLGNPRTPLLTLLPFSVLTLVRQSVMGGLLMASFKNATWGSYPLPLCFWYSVKCNREQRHSIVLATVTWTALLFLFEPGIHLELLSSGCFFVTHVCSSLHWRFIDLDIISVLGIQHDELISLCIVNW